VTQQNAALVEEAAAAAASLQEQAAGLSQVVSVFKLDNEQVHHATATQYAEAIKPRPAPQQPPRAKAALAAPRRSAADLASASGNWKTF